MADELTIETPVQSEPAKISDNQVQDISTEPAKISDTPESQVAEVEVTPYSDEEFGQIKDFKTADPQRLAKTYERKDKSYKELQGEYTKVTQRQSVEQQKTGRPSDPQQGFAYDVIEAAGKDDYVTVNRMIGSIDVVIENKRNALMQAAANYDEAKTKELAESIQKDVRYKNDLNVAISNMYQERQLYGNLNESLDSEIIRKIPDFKNLAPEIGKYALGTLKMDQRTIENTMDPLAYDLNYLSKKYGVSRKQALEMAKNTVVDLTRTMHDVYMRMSGKALQEKEVKKPPVIEGGGQKTNETKITKFKNDSDVENEIARIKYGGR